VLEKLLGGIRVLPVSVCVECLVGKQNKPTLFKVSRCVYALQVSVTQVSVYAL